jgi:hypothetical protein
MSTEHNIATLLAQEMLQTTTHHCQDSTQYTNLSVRCVYPRAALEGVRTKYMGLLWA